MLMIHPLPHAFSPWKAALLMVNVPSVSMSKTALCYTVMSVHGHVHSCRYGVCWSLTGRTVEVIS